MIRISSLLSFGNAMSSYLLQMSLMLLHVRLWCNPAAWIDIYSKRLAADQVKVGFAYARYEQGVSVPAVDKLDELLRAVAPERQLVVRETTAAWHLNGMPAVPSACGPRRSSSRSRATARSYGATTGFVSVPTPS
jgi:hypothetical protein